MSEMQELSVSSVSGGYGRLNPFSLLRNYVDIVVSLHIYLPAEHCKDSLFCLFV